MTLAPYLAFLGECVPVLLAARFFSSPLEGKGVQTIGTRLFPKVDRRRLFLGSLLAKPADYNFSVEKINNR